MQYLFKDSQKTQKLKKTFIWMVSKQQIAENKNRQQLSADGEKGVSLHLPLPLNIYKNLIPFFFLVFLSLPLSFVCGYVNGFDISSLSHCVSLSLIFMYENVNALLMFLCLPLYM